MPAAPSHLFLRPTVIAGQRGEDDFQVIWDGIPIGRILKQPGVPFDRPGSRTSRSCPRTASWRAIWPNASAVSKPCGRASMRA
jgi:hypothetical protein